MTLQLIDINGGAAHKVLKFAPPTKFSVVNIKINDEDVEARVTTGRAKTYTYFPVKNVGHYVEGALTEGQAFTLEVPEGEIKGPAWDSTRKSYYVHKRPKKEQSNEEQNGQAQSEQAGASDASAESASGEPVSGSDAQSAEEVEGSSAPRARRRRGE